MENTVPGPVNDAARPDAAADTAPPTAADRFRALWAQTVPETALARDTAAYNAAYLHLAALCAAFDQKGI